MCVCAHETVESSIIQNTTAVERPFQSISGNSYILTVSDYFTRFGWAKALPTKEAVNVVQALREVFSPFPVKTRRGNRSGIRKTFDIKIQLQNA